MAIPIVKKPYLYVQKKGVFVFFLYVFLQMEVKFSVEQMMAFYMYMIESAINELYG